MILYNAELLITATAGSHLKLLQSSFVTPNGAITILYNAARRRHNHAGVQNPALACCIAELPSGSCAGVRGRHAAAGVPCLRTTRIFVGHRGPATPVATALSAPAEAARPMLATVGEGPAVATDALLPTAVTSTLVRAAAPLAAVTPGVEASALAGADGREADAAVHLLAVFVEVPLGAIHALRPLPVGRFGALQAPRASSANCRRVASGDGRGRREGTRPAAQGRCDLPHLLVHPDTVPWKAAPRAVNALRPTAIGQADASEAARARAIARPVGATCDPRVV